MDLCVDRIWTLMDKLQLRFPDENMGKVFVEPWSQRFRSGLLECVSRAVTLCWWARRHAIRKNTARRKRGGCVIAPELTRVYSMVCGRKLPFRPTTVMEPRTWAFLA